MILKCENIYKTYKKGGFFSNSSPKNVLNGVNLEIHKNRSAGLLGVNGIGKSTLTRLILGLEQPDSGEIYLNGKNISSLGRAAIHKKVQAVFQDASSTLNPRWNVLKAVSEPVLNFEKKSKSELEDIVAGLLVSVGLAADDMYKNVTKFSGGQLQRICIARALAVNPELLILDEALSNLDMVVQAQIIELLKELKQAYNTTLLLVSHDIRVVLQLCEDILVLEKGKIAEKLTIETGFSAAKSKTFKSLLDVVR